MIRSVFTPKNEEISIRLPLSYIGKQVEVIAFTVEEGFAKKENSHKNISFVELHVEDKNHTFNRDEANER